MPYSLLRLLSANYPFIWPGQASHSAQSRWPKRLSCDHLDYNESDFGLKGAKPLWFSIVPMELIKCLLRCNWRGDRHEKRKIDYKQTEINRL